MCLNDHVCALTLQTLTTQPPVVNNTQGKAEEWKRAWGLKPSMAYELYIHLANVMKVRKGVVKNAGGDVVANPGVGCCERIMSSEEG